jgi:hypothetical protein
MKNGSIYPPRWQLAIYTRISESNISKRTGKLAELGWLTITARKGKVNQYHLHIPAYVIAREQVVKEAVRKERETRAETRKKENEQWRASGSAGSLPGGTEPDDYDEADDFLEQDE